MINPITKKRNHLYLYFLFWVFVAILQTTVLHWTQEISWTIAGVEAFIYSILFGLVGLSIWFVVRFTGLEVSNLWNAIINHVGAASILVFAWFGISHSVTSILLDKQIAFSDLSVADFGWRIAIGYVYYLLVSLNYYLLIFYQNYREKQVAELEMKSLLKESELSMLKAQLNPHFIFNSLNSISALTLTRPEDAHEMIVKLSTFLRHTIGHSETELVTLQKEIETISLYLDIEKSRFGERLIVEMEGINEIDEGIKLPNLILQPLVENAIKYGIYENLESSKIQLSFSSSEDFLMVKIKNNCEDKPVNTGKGIGLKNVKGRLSYIYDRGDLVQTEQSENNYQVTLKIPQKK